MVGFLSLPNLYLLFYGLKIVILSVNCKAIVMNVVNEMQSLTINKNLLYTRIYLFLLFADVLAINGTYLYIKVFRVMTFARISRKKSLTATFIVNNFLTRKLLAAKNK